VNNLIVKLGDLKVNDRKGCCKFRVILWSVGSGFPNGDTGALLVRQYLKGETTGRLLLYMVGMVLAFNLGRDTTLITLYPFLFGFIMLVVFSRARGER
jgi:hypothetical protein